MEHFLLTVKEIEPHYQIHVFKKGTMLQIELQVEITESLFNELQGNMNHLNIASLKKEIQNLIKNNCIIPVDVIILQAKSIPRSEGKAERIANQIDASLEV